MSIVLSGRVQKFVGATAGVAGDAGRGIDIQQGSSRPYHIEKRQWSGERSALQAVYAGNFDPPAARE
jgi:hypothetical protein